MERPVLMAETRQDLKKGKVRKLRTRGMIPPFFTVPGPRRFLNRGPEGTEQNPANGSGGQRLDRSEYPKCGPIDRKVVMLKTSRWIPLNGGSSTPILRSDHG